MTEISAAIHNRSGLAMTTTLTMTGKTTLTGTDAHKKVIETTADATTLATMIKEKDAASTSSDVAKTKNGGQKLTVTLHISLGRKRLRFFNSLSQISTA